MMADQYGLIGYPLGHSFSKKFFEEKFSKLKLPHKYTLFELNRIDEVEGIISNYNLKGFNVTIPYKQEIIPFLSKLDKSAELVGAVNVVKIVNGKLIGYNTDYPAFRTTLKKWLDNSNLKALVLGTGGASKAIVAALNDLKIAHHYVSRTKSETSITYQQLNNSKQFIQEFNLIINTTPLGTTPNVESAPEIPYNLLTPSHYLYDLVYNPEQTRFLKNASTQSCKTKNGVEMLHLQAELTWDIWNA